MPAFQVLICADGLLVHAPVVGCTGQVSTAGRFGPAPRVGRTSVGFPDTGGTAYMYVLVNGIVVHVRPLKAKLLYLKVKNGKKGVNKVQ